MTKKPQTSKEYFNTLIIIYYVLIGGQLLFGFVSLVLHQSETFDPAIKELRDIFIFVVPFFVLGGLLGSNIMFKYQLKVCKSKPDLMEKMTCYRSALIIRYALLEGPSFFSIVVYLLTRDMLFLGMAGVIILIFLSIKPAISKAVIDLELNTSDSQAINNPGKVISEIRINQ